MTLFVVGNYARPSPPNWPALADRRPRDRQPRARPRPAARGPRGPARLAAAGRADAGGRRPAAGAGLPVAPVRRTGLHGAGPLPRPGGRGRLHLCVGHQPTGCRLAGARAAGADHPRRAGGRRQLPAAAPVRAVSAASTPPRTRRCSTTIPTISERPSRARRASARWPWPSSCWAGGGSPVVLPAPRAATAVRRVQMSDGDFKTYFHERAGPVLVLLLERAGVPAARPGSALRPAAHRRRHGHGLSATRVLDVGCGSGPLFAPLVDGRAST